MGRPKKEGPRYLPHSQTGRARAVWNDQTGRQREQLLPGPFDSLESKQAWARFLLEQQIAPKEPILSEAARGKLTLVELLDAYFTHAQRHYRRQDGKPTSELAEVKLVVRALREAYGSEPAANFSQLKLKAVRNLWVSAALSRTEVNRRVGIVKRIFKWACSDELVPAPVYHALCTVGGLQKGRTSAPETEPIGPVADEVVSATLPHLNRHVRGLVEFQRLTGCRPGEACALRLCDIDRTGAVWMFRPPQHKTAHKGKGRVVAIGPKAQAVLKPFLSDDAQAYLFSPALAVAEVRAVRAAARKTPRYKSHMARNKSKRKRNPKRAPAGGYTSHSYTVAVGRACDVAFPLPADLAPQPKESKAKWLARLTPGERERVKAFREANRWQPNQLRHSFATAVRKLHGLEGVQVALGHAKADVSQIYAEKNESLAAKIAAELG